jgi:hypothetical protein
MNFHAYHGNYSGWRIRNHVVDDGFKILYDYFKVGNSSTKKDRWNAYESWKDIISQDIYDFWYKQLQFVVKVGFLDQDKNCCWCGKKDNLG